MVVCNPAVAEVAARLATTNSRYIAVLRASPCLGSHFTIWLDGSKQALVISATDSCSW